MGAVAVAAGDPATGESTVGGAAPAGGFEGIGGGLMGFTGAVSGRCACAWPGADVWDWPA